MNILLCVAMVFALQDPRAEPKREDILKKVDRAKVDQAIRKGVAYLFQQMDQNALEPVEQEKKGHSFRFDDFLLLTFVHAGVPAADPHFQKVLRTCLEQPLEYTYHASMQAMAFLKLDKAQYQWRIAQCAQFLVDNQHPERGQWGYGKPVPLDHIKKPAAAPKKGTRALERIEIRRRERISEKVDLSNAQFAVMGLRAAHDASIVVPRETLALAAHGWDEMQNADGGWGYQKHYWPESYVGMTAGGMASLSALAFMTGAAPRLDPRVLRARTWLTERWPAKDGKLVNDHPQIKGYFYYQLYAIERAGILFGSELFGAHEWYPEIANFVLEEQRPDGSWPRQPQDTCFAILILRRASDEFRPPVFTESARK